MSCPQLGLCLKHWFGCDVNIALVHEPWPGWLLGGLDMNVAARVVRRVGGALTGRGALGLELTRYRCIVLFLRVPGISTPLHGLACVMSEDN